MIHVPDIEAMDVWASVCVADNYKSLPEGDFDTGGYLLALVDHDGIVDLAATVHPRRHVAHHIRSGQTPSLILLSHPVLRYERLKRMVMKKAEEQGLSKLDAISLGRILRELDYRSPLRDTSTQSD